MKGWLVVNAYIKTEKFRDLFAMIIRAGKRHHCQVEIHTNEEVWKLLIKHNYDIKKELEDVEFILFWDKDLLLATALEQQKIRLFNSAKSIALCDDKAQTQLALLNKGIRMPKTIFQPKAFPSAKTAYLDYYLEQVNLIGYPCVLKESFGSFGQQVYLPGNPEELVQCIRSIYPRPFLVQEYIASSKGRDIRVQVTGTEVVAAMYRYNENDFRANVTNGGNMLPYEVNEKERKMALKVCRELELDFGGIDLLFGENDEPVFCEANSNAHFKNLYDCTGIDAGDFIFEHIKKVVYK